MGWGTREGPRGTGFSLGWLVSSFPCLFSIMGLGIGVPQVTCGQVPVSPAVLGAGCEGRSQAPSCGRQLLPGLLKPGPLHASLAEQQDGAQDPKNVAEKEKGRGCPAKHAAETVLRPWGPHCRPHTRAARAGLAPGPPVLFPWGQKTGNGAEEGPHPGDTASCHHEGWPCSTGTSPEVPSLHPACFNPLLFLLLVLAGGVLLSSRCPSIQPPGAGQHGKSCQRPCSPCSC